MSFLDPIIDKLQEAAEYLDEFHGGREMNEALDALRNLSKPELEKLDTFKLKFERDNAIEDIRAFARRLQDQTDELVALRRELAALRPKE